MEANQSNTDENTLPSSTSHIFKKFQKLYAKQLKEADETTDGLKLKVKILENWVEDLTEQNVMLVKTVDELETEALKRLSMLEANISQGQETANTAFTPGRNSFPGKGLNCQIETLCRELEQVKKQLSDKEKLISKYQSRFEELGSSIEGDECSKVFYSRTESICDPDRNVQPSVYRELETARLQLSHVEKEVIQLKKKLKEAESNIKRLRSDLVASEKNAREMRAALTAEVAEKHDQILALRREVNQLEEQLRQADMQTHFKDDIIKELRKEVKVARSKETLVEVLGIKERSLSHLEHLTEQLEQKDQVISCLKQQMTQGSTDLLYRVRQQVDWFTENVTQQYGQGNCSEEFKKCITTMLEELKESIECCNLGPSDTTELSKESIKFVSALQKSLEKSKQDLCQSWLSISDTVHQMNKMDLAPLVDQWKKGLCKQKSLQQKLQEIVRSIISITSCSNVNVESITKSMDSLQSLLFKFTDELNSQPRGRSFTGWLKNLHGVVTELITKIQEITQIISDIRSNDDETHAELVTKMQLVDSMQWDLNEALCLEMKAYEKLCKKEKTQRVKIDTLLATVLHHQEIWNQQVSLTDDLMREISRLSHNLNQNTSQPKQALCDEIQSPIKERSKHLQSLVSKISADIRKSLCDIEQRQNQVSHLELDLSSVRMVLESAQHEIDEISKTYNAQDMRHKVTVLLHKLKKQIANASTKANNLVKAYANTKQEYVSSSERILHLQKEWEVLEQEVRSQWAQLSKDFKKPPKSDREPCPSQTVLATYEQKVKKLNETLDSYFLQHQTDKYFGKQLHDQMRGVERALRNEDAAIQKVKGNVMDLKSNIKDRDKLTDTQDKTICVLQNSLKRSHNEADELRRTIRGLEAKQCEVEVESGKKIQELESKILKLQNSLKKYEEANDLKEFDFVEKLQNANYELASLACNLQEDCRSANLKIAKLYDQLTDNEKYHQKTEEALKLVNADLKENISKEQKKLSNLQNKYNLLEKQLEDCKTTCPAQDKSVDSLQNLLKASQKEVEHLHHKIHCLECKKEKAEKEHLKQIEKLQSELENCHKLGECTTPAQDKSVDSLQNALKASQKEVEHLHHKIHCLECKKEKVEKEHQKQIEKLQSELENCHKLGECTTPAQDKSVDSLQNALKASQKEVEHLHHKIMCLECKKEKAEKEYLDQIQKLQSELGNCHKLGEGTTVFIEDDSLRHLQNANLELAVLAGHLQEDYRNAETKLSELYCQTRDNETKHHKSEAALQLVIANLKETISKEKKKHGETEKENQKLRDQVKQLEDSSKNESKSNQETLDKIADLKTQIKLLSKKASDLDDKLKNVQEKLFKSIQREKELELELCSKDLKCKEEICRQKKENNELTKAVQSLTERLNETKTDLDATRLKNCEAQVKLQDLCRAYEELKVKEREKEAQADKLQVALTQLSNKFVSRRLDTGASQCVRHYQEECAKYEALYNTTACKLRSKEVEISSLKQDMERLRSELDHVAVTTSRQKEDESCPFLMERVHQLSKELQVAHSCQNSYESLLKDIREKYSKKEEENFNLKTQIKQVTMQRDTILADLEQAQQEINRLKINNSSFQTTIKRLEQNNAQVCDQLHKAVYESDHPGAAHLQPNIELQREISTALTSQLRGVKQKLHTTKHDYKLLQTAYEELNRKYTVLQRGERDMEQVKELKPASKPDPRLRPCMAKSSKSVTYIKMPEDMSCQDHMEYLSHSKSWHKMDNNKDLEWRERRWKRKLQEVIRGGFDPAEAICHDASSSN